MSSAGAETDILLKQAVDQYNRGDLSAAKSACDKVTTINPTQPDALNLLAVIARATKRWGQAEKIARFALAKNSRNSQLSNTLGLILLDQRRVSEAVDAFEVALSSQSLRPDYLSNLALARQRLGQWEDAIAVYAQALEIQPDFIPALLGRAAISTEMGDFQTAASDLSVVGSLVPNAPELHSGRAVLALGQGDLAGAFDAFDRAVQVSEHVADAKVNRGLIRMLQGRVEEGWVDYTMRRQRRWGRAVARHVGIPHWSGEDLSGKSILIWCEQGLGEAVLCASLIHDLEDAAASVTLECDPRIAPLFARSFPKSQVVADAAAEHSRPNKFSVDYQAAIFDLIGYLDAGCYDRPSRAGYLTFNTIKSEKTRQRYFADGHKDKLVGLSWASPNAAAARQKGMNVKDWEPLLRTPGLTFVNLQYGTGMGAMAEIARECGARFIDDPDIGSSASLDILADQIAAVDLVVTVSNTTAHIAGGLGKEAWVIVPPLGLGSMWYWFADRTDSPWYQSVCLIRRQIGEDALLMSDVAARLKNWAHQNA